MESTSFPGPLLFGKMRDPGNEVETESLKQKKKTYPEINLKTTFITSISTFVPSPWLIICKGITLKVLDVRAVTGLHQLYN